MAIEDDVLVVGGGLAGATAALAAAREGVRVRLVSHRKSTLRQASGLVDVLGYPPNARRGGGDSADAGRDPDAGLVADPFDAIPDLPDGHPYSVVGVEAVREGLALFDEIAGARYRGDHTDRNALVPTVGGTVKPTARYPRSVAPGLASMDGDVLLVSFEGTTDFDAPLAAAHLQEAGVPFEVDGASVSFPGVAAEDAKATRFASVLDDDPEARQELAARIEPHLDGHARVGLPAVLGRTAVAEVRADLQAVLGTTVFEVPTGPPSVLGMRLEDLLYDALEEAGVHVETGNPVVDVEADGQGIDRVLVDHTGNHLPYRASAYVLATGGLVGGGVDSDREGVREPVFDCHVPHPEDRYDWFEREAFGDHAFARFGVVPDDRLRPTDADGDPEYRNLFAAGAVLGGADFATEKSGSGVSLATGHRAGKNAATHAAQETPEVRG